MFPFFVVEDTSYVLVNEELTNSKVLQSATTALIRESSSNLHVKHSLFKMSSSVLLRTVQ